MSSDRRPTSADFSANGINHRVFSIMKPSSLSSTHLLLISSLWFVTAHAETSLPEITIAAEQSEPTARLPLDTTSKTGSRLGLTVRDTPASVHVIDHETIEARGARDTLEVLQSAPGIIADSPPGSGGNVSMRGFSSSQITQLFNGIDVAYVIAASPLDSWLLDRVDVLGGASSFLYGQGAVGGAINYISKVATRQPLQQDALIRGGDFGTYQAAYDINGALTGNGTESATNFFRLAVSHQGTDGYVDRTDGRSTVLSASWLTDITDNLSHTLAYEHQIKDLLPYWGTPLLNPTALGEFIEATRFKNYNTQNGVYEQRVNWLRSLLEYRLSDKTTINNTAYYYDADRDYRNVETYRFNATNTAVIRSGTLKQKHLQTLVGNRLELAHQGSLGQLPSSWSFGLDVSRNKQTRYPNSLAGNVSTVDPYHFALESFFDIPGTGAPTTPDRTNHVYTTALYAENMTRLNSRWRLLSGLRYDHIKLEVTNFRAITAANPAYFERTYTPVTGRLGLMYDITPKANAYITYSTAADPPSGILTTANYGSVQDFDLTTGKQLEIGSKFDFWEGRGNATLAAYTITRKNLSTPDQNNPTITVPVGQQSSKGIEMQAGIKLSPQWSLRGDISFIDAEYDKFVQNVGGVGISRAGNTPTFVPDRVANLYLGWAIASNWQLTGEVRNVSERFGNVENTQRFSGYTLLGASLNYTLDKHSTIILRGRNLTDEIYFASGGGGQVRIGEPRAFEISLRTTF
uniref:TonB-dependent siderophore receptor n=1 Tax=uncultured bacterium UPO46 TaxID=1776971 RepID=A0A126SY75_9BACT|nr:TonB-dependent siderophore receptor [uncultured bacterium UPO46]